MGAHTQMMQTAILIGSVSRNAGGLFESVRRLSQNIHAQDVSVEVFSIRDEHTAADVADWQPLKTHLFDVRGPKAFAYAPGMLSELKTNNFQMIHAHGIWMYPSVVNLLNYAVCTTPYVISPHGMLDPWAVRNSVWKKKLAGGLFENRHLRNAACIRSLCMAETDAVREYGLRNPVCQIPNGIDLVETGCTVPPPWQGKVETGKKILLYLGRIHPKKGLANLLHAWAAVRDAAKEWHLVIAGWDQGGHEDELKKLACDLGIDARTLFVGSQFGEAKSAAYHHADAFILPSFSEGLPMVILEAWANRLPVLMTTFCNLPEGYEENAALRIGTGPEDIAQGLRDMFSMSPQEREKMGEQGLALVKKQFTWSVIASEMKSVYQWLLGGGAPPQSIRIPK